MTRRAAPGARTAQIIALWQSGELVATARASTSQVDMARRLGMSADALMSAIGGARDKGHAIPTYAELANGTYTAQYPAQGQEYEPFTDEEPTRPNIRHEAEQRPDFGHAIGMHTSTVQHLPARPNDDYAAWDAAMAARQAITNDHLAVESATDHSNLIGKWPHLEAFDAVGEPVPLPPLGPHAAARSTLIDADGNVKLQWIKTGRTDRLDALLEAIKRLGDDMPKAEAVAAPSYTESDLLCVYPMGDPHLGMLAWAPEAGENFDTTIAERQLFAAADQLVNLAPAAQHALVLNLGDYFHADGPANTTTAGTRVDVDGRWAKVLAAGIRTMRRIVDRALEKHAHVTVINEIGNHDTNSSIMLSLALAQFYERESRVTVDTSPEPFHWYRFGACLIGAHHGNRVKRDDLGAVMACDRAKDWGETRHRRIYVGHVHHDTVKELRGVTVESLRTLAPSDAWHRGQGYRSGRDMKLDVWHREHGHINRHIVGVSQLETA